MIYYGSTDKRVFRVWRVSENIEEEGILAFEGILDDELKSYTEI